MSDTMREGPTESDRSEGQLVHYRIQSLDGFHVDLEFSAGTRVSALQEQLFSILRQDRGIFNASQVRLSKGDQMLCSLQQLPIASGSEDVIVLDMILDVRNWQAVVNDLPVTDEMLIVTEGLMELSSMQVTGAPDGTAGSTAEFGEMVRLVDALVFNRMGLRRRGDDTTAQELADILRELKGEGSLAVLARIIDDYL